MVSRTPRKFRNAVQDKLCCAFSDLHGCIEFMAGGPVWTHQIPAWWDAHRAQIVAALPALAAYEIGDLRPETFDAWKSERAEFLDAETEVWPLGGAPESPFDHLPEGKPVIVVSCESEALSSPQSRRRNAE
jgi:hypothetical protein